MGKSLNQLIEEQVGSWSIEEERWKHGEKFWPIITISRSYGARGAELATALGERTGFTVWNKELLTAIADESGADERLMMALDERIKRSFNDIVHGILTGSQHTNLQYFRSLANVVSMIALHGSGIIVGRGANFMVKDERKLLSIRVVSPLPIREERFARRNDMSIDQARKLIQKRGQERMDFIQYHFKKDVRAADNYDLTINSAPFTIEQMTDIVMQAYELKTGLKLSAHHTP